MYPAKRGEKEYEAVDLRDDKMGKQQLWEWATER